MFKRLFKDRNDGYLIKHHDPVLRAVPYIMPKRYDAQVYFSDTLNLNHSEKIIKDLRKDGHRIIFLHVVLAAMLRTMTDYPKVNRFVKGRKVYARKKISFSFAIKKEMTLEASETVLKLDFDRSDTLIDVVNKVNDAIIENKEKDNKNKTDRAARILYILPGFLFRFAVGLVNFLDNHRLLPKFIVSASPFHTSAFATDLGSIGIKPIYHHIYDFGTTSFFASFGTKRRTIITNGDNTTSKVKQMDIKITVDERVCDGFYFARVVKQLMRYIENPERMLEAPKEIPKDDEIR